MKTGERSSSIRDSLQQKAWYRFCRLCYGFAYAVSLALAVAVGYAERPVEYIDNNRSVIHCASGEDFSPTRNSISTVDGNLDPHEDEKARKLCTSRWFLEESIRFPNGQTYKVNIPTWKDPQAEIRRINNLIENGTILDTLELAIHTFEYSDYTFIPVKSVTGSYTTLLWGLGIVVLVGELIRRSFLYVVAGVPFFHW